MLKKSRYIAASTILAASCIPALAADPFAPPNPVSNQGVQSAAITPSDTVALLIPRAIFNGNATACNIAMKLANDAAAVTWINVQPGQILPVMPRFVMSTNTTCANVIAIY